MKGEMIMVVNPLFLANNFIKRSLNEKIALTPMKLQKLLYFTYRDYLKKTDGESLISERFLTWQYGPVLDSVYQAFKEYKDKPISSFYSCNGEAYTVRETSDPLLKEVLDDVWHRGKGFNGIYLSKLTHRQDSAWDKAYQSDAPFLLDDDIKAENIEIE